MRGSSITYTTYTVRMLELGYGNGRRTHAVRAGNFTTGTMPFCKTRVRLHTNNAQAHESTARADPLRCKRTYSHTFYVRKHSLEWLSQDAIRCWLAACRCWCCCFSCWHWHAVWHKTPFQRHSFVRTSTFAAAQHICVYMYTCTSDGYWNASHRMSLPKRPTRVQHPSDITVINRNCLCCHARCEPSITAIPCTYIILNE